MLWPQMILARGFLRLHWRGLTLQLVVTAIVVLVCSVSMAVVQGVDRDLARAAEELSLDIVLLDSVPVDRTDEMLRQLSRRPDVNRVSHLDRESVWQRFQSDIGVRSEGMAEVAALPEVVRLRLGNEYVSVHHASELARGLHRHFGSEIETVIMPSEAISGIEQRRTDMNAVRTTLLWLAVALNLALSLGTARWIVTRSAIPVSLRLGRTAHWARLGPTIVVMISTVVAGLIAQLAGILLAPRLSTTYTWLSEPFLGRTFLQVPIVLTCAMIVQILLLMLVPSRKARGWQ